MSSKESYKERNEMRSRFLKVFVMSLLTLIVSQTATAKYSQNPKLGINVGDLGKLSSSIPFIVSLL